ncbi:hypothetical protein SISNIDRAFT_166721 [Sistotremastrum niveocremeum HHB9708]|uniref:Uncharacterized protein n=1 Tax=Sistotremastrum niveocremeum HHB9708 TaxID=1314777 RepID=A0A164S8J9_9AGAM|nr:hypothetical protein SISNIDRAFT_166721 [Sistotremastrum niveocremeum HHB9708]
MSRNLSTPPGISTDLTKRAREIFSSRPQQKSIDISSGNDAQQKALIRTVKRTSSLEALIVSPRGAHWGEILNHRFGPHDKILQLAHPSRIYVQY